MAVIDIAHGKVKLKEVPPGEVICATGIVVRPNENGQVLMWGPGIGETGRWSMVNSVLVEVMDNDFAAPFLKSMVLTGLPHLFQ